jgi:hypothetical protein
MSNHDTPSKDKFKKQTTPFKGDLRDSMIKVNQTLLEVKQ